MEQDVIYYVPAVESVNKRKHLLFLQKNGFILHKVTTIDILKSKLENIKPLAIVIHDDATIKEVSSIIDVPIIILSESLKNIAEIMPNLHIDNMVFFRTENDPIDSVLEILRFLSNLCEERAV